MNERSRAVANFWLINVIDAITQTVTDIFVHLFTVAWSAVRFGLNKLPFALLLWLGFKNYNMIVAVQSAKEAAALKAGLVAPAALPFMEVYYAILSIGVAVLLAFVIRLGVFPETAEYAETGKLREDMLGTAFPPRLIHYWFATAICFAAVLFCLSNLPK